MVRTAWLHSRSGAWIGVPSVLVACVVWAATAPGSGGPCAGKSGSRPRTRFDFRAGVDLRLYHQFSGRYDVALTGDPRKDGQRLQEARLKAYKDALAQITLLRGLSYKGAFERYERAFDRLVTAGDQSVLRRDIRPLLERETEDYEKCLYSYEVVLGLRLQTRLDELESPLEASVLDYLQKLPETDGGVDINMADLFRHLRHDPRFTERVVETWSEDARREPFLYKDDDTQMFLAAVARRDFKISHYEKGQYSPSTVLSAILLRAVRPKVLDLLRRYRRVGVTCVGSTDRLAITRGLPYGGEGRMTGSPGGLALGATSGRPLGGTLDDNLELSFARAHEALAVLASGLPRNERLSLRYVGRGEERGGSTDDPFSRKITIEIRGHGRYE